jgi:hypothetical protein
MKAMSRRLKLLTPVICEGWHITHMWNALSRPHHITVGGGGDHKTVSSTPPLYIVILVISGHVFVC